MIKKYNQFINESLLDKLKGPTKEEIDELLKNKTGYDLFLTASKVGDINIIKKFINNDKYNDIFERYGETAIYNSISTHNLNLIKLLYNKYCEKFNKTDLEIYSFIAESIDKENYESFLFFNKEYDLTEEDLDQLFENMFDAYRTHNGMFDIYYKYLIDKYELYYGDYFMNFIETKNLEIIKYILSYKKIDLDEISFVLDQKLIHHDDYIEDKEILDLLIDYKNNNSNNDKEF